jgi:hypothetical protein
MRYRTVVPYLHSIEPFPSRNYIPHNHNITFQYPRKGTRVLYLLPEAPVQVEHPDDEVLKSGGEGGGTGGKLYHAALHG